MGTLQCRSLAIGICLCGIGSGTFAIAPISNMILEKYGWRTVMRQEEYYHCLIPLYFTSVTRTFSCFSGLGIFAGATMLPVTSPREKTLSEDKINNNGHHNEKTNRVWRFLLGQELASNKKLYHYFLFVLTDFLYFMSIYISFVHLPTFVQVAIYLNYVTTFIG